MNPNQEFLQDAGAEVFSDELQTRRERRREIEREDLAVQFFNLVTLATGHIKPCPFCGQTGRYARNGRMHWIGCQNADCTVQPLVEMPLGNSTAGELVDSWNTRPADSGESL